MEFDLATFQRARDLVRKGGVQQTVVKKSTWLSKETGAEVYLKYENQHEGSSFKVRGATHYLYAHKEKYGEFPKRVVTASGGNHGIAVAVACSKLKIECLVFLPNNSVTPSKLYVLETCYGAKVVVEGTCFQEANDSAQKMVTEESTCYIHPYAHPWIVQGAGTMLLELNEQISNIDVIAASLGGGGMIAGLITAAKASNLNIEFVSAETEGADYYYQSVQRGELITLPKITSIASTLGASTGTPESFQLFTENIKHPLLVSDREAVDALWKLLKNEYCLVEPSCSATIAALLKYPEIFKGKRVVVILCGGNPSLDECTAWKKKYLESTDSQ